MTAPTPTSSAARDAAKPCADLVAEHINKMQVAMGFKNQPDVAEKVSACFAREFEQIIQRAIDTAHPPLRWTRTADRLPDSTDCDCDGKVWVASRIGEIGRYRLSDMLHTDTHWMPTGLKRPALPQPCEEGEK